MAATLEEPGMKSSESPNKHGFTRGAEHANAKQSDDQQTTRHALNRHGTVLSRTYHLVFGIVF